MYKLYVNTAPFYVRDLSVHELWYTVVGGDLGTKYPLTPKDSGGGGVCANVQALFLLEWMIKKHKELQSQNNFIGVLRGQQTAPPKSIDSLIPKTFIDPWQHARQHGEMKKAGKGRPKCLLASGRSSQEGTTLDQGPDVLLTLCFCIWQPQL